eukprot:TRINITY_DN1914_c0_g1_i1.p1 TRINITY_DN1914_c0_g1~~TRINITY_DN1914_c0_g1_i1.p1  ORF type:complete len:730 (-),score=140.36 TRINITY_DN1914_c0_g1_i1:57-2246(-)
MEPTDPIQTLPDDIVKYILCDFMDDLVHMTRFIMASQKLYDVSEWREKKAICIRSFRRSVVVSGESLHPNLTQLNKLGHLEVLDVEESGLPARPFLDWLSQLSCLRDLSLCSDPILRVEEGEEKQMRKIPNFCFPNLKSFRLRSNAPNMADRILRDYGSQLEELRLPCNYLWDKLTQKALMPLKKLRLLEMEFQYSSFPQQMKSLLDVLNDSCKICIVQFPEPDSLAKQHKGQFLHDRFSRLFIPLPSTMKELQTACETYFDAPLQLDRVLLNGRPFASLLIDLARIVDSPSDLDLRKEYGKPDPVIVRLRFPEQNLPVLIELYKQVKSVAPHLAMQYFIQIVTWIGKKTPEWLWLVNREFEDLLANYELYDRFETYLISFCAIFFDRSPQSPVTALDPFVSFINSRQRNDLLPVFKRFANEQTSCFRAVLLHAFGHPVLGPVAVALLNSFSADRLIGLPDEALVAFLLRPDCTITNSDDLFEARSEKHWTRSWPLLKILLQMRINRKKVFDTTLKPLHYIAGFLRFDGAAAGTKAALAAADLLEDEALMIEFALMFIDAPLLFRKEHVDSRLLRCIREPNAADLIFRPWLVLRDFYRGDDTKPQEEYSHLCTDERLASLFCRSILSNLAQDFSQFVAAALDIFPPLASELKSFCSGKSTLYVEQVRSTNVPVSEAIKIIESALAAAGYVLDGIKANIDEFDYEYDDWCGSNFSEDSGFSSEQEDELSG